MKLAYVAGPYRSPTEYGIRQNIRRASDVALELWRAGYAVICPHANTAGWGGAHGLDDQVWLDGDLEILKRCDLVVVLLGWQNSKGTVVEVKVANTEGIPVYFWDRDKDFLLEDLKQHVDSL